MLFINIFREFRSRRKFIQVHHHPRKCALLPILSNAILDGLMSCLCRITLKFTLNVLQIAECNAIIHKLKSCSSKELRGKYICISTYLLSIFICSLICNWARAAADNNNMVNATCEKELFDRDKDK